MLIPAVSIRSSTILIFWFAAYRHKLFFFCVEPQLEWKYLLRSTACTVKNGHKKMLYEASRNVVAFENKREREKCKNNEP